MSNGEAESQSRRRRGLWWKIPLIVLGLLLAAAALHIPTGPAEIEISPETTYLTGPLRPDGTVDYLAYINAQGARGVTDANDATPGILRVIGMGAIPPQVADKLLAYKGLSVRDVGVGLFVPWEDRADKGPLLDANAAAAPGPGEPAGDGLLDPNTLGRRLAVQAVQDELHLYEVVAQVADGNVHPQLEPWLAENAAALALLTQTARQRSRLHLPLLTEKEDDLLYGFLLPGLTGLREATRGLVARAHVRKLRGDDDGAWADVLTAHRLSRLLYQQPTLIDKLVAISCQAMAFEVARDLIADEAFGASEAASLLAKLTEIGPPPTIDEAYLFERFIMLDFIAHLARDYSLAKELGAASGPASVLVRGADWNLVLRRANDWYDAMPLPRQSGGPTSTPAGRARYERMCDSLRLPNTKLEQAKVMALALGGVATRRARSEFLARCLGCSLLPSLTRSCGFQDRAVMQYRLERTALALAAHKARTGRWPSALADLTPGLLKAVPDDLFQGPAGGPIRYKTASGGYVLYSLGVDGDDDGGAETQDSDDDGDIVVRVEAE